MSKKNLKTVATEVFKNYPDLNQIYLTSDGQAFTDEEKAIDNARYHKDKEITPFTRPSDGVLGKDTGFSTEDRALLMQEYEDLFGEKAAHNIGTAKLQEKIAGKKAEILDSANK